MSVSRRGWDPVPDRRERGLWPCALQPCLQLPCLVLTGLILLSAPPAQAQTVTPDMLRPVQGSTTAPSDSALRKTPLTSGVLPNPGGPDARPLSQRPQAAPEAEKPAPSRINRLQTYDVPAASGSGTTGFDSLNRRRAKAKVRPGAPKPKTLPGASPRGPSIYVQPPPSVPTFSASVPTVTSTAAPSLLSAPPAASANRAPVSQSFAGTYPGSPQRRRLKPDDDPFGAVGFYAGSFLVKPAIELSGGYDTNPSRLANAKGSSFYAISPEVTAASNWSRHSLSTDLRGTFTGYDISSNTSVGGAGGVTPAPSNIDRPEFTGRVNGRFDVSRDQRINGEGRARISTDNPGSPNIQVGLSKYPLFLTTGATLGIEQDYNRFTVAVNGIVDRTQFQNSRLTDGTSAPNDDRNFNQYAGQLRLSYDLMPGVKPFAEATLDKRVRDTAVDRSGFQRNSEGTTVRAGSTFELSRLLIGEASIGYVTRKYEDPRLNDLTGLLTRASLTYLVTPLTTVKLVADSSVEESPLFGVSGVLTRTYTLEVDHDFRRWLTGIGKLSTGTIDYQGGTRADKFYSVSGNLIYKLTRELWIKGEVRHDWLDSNLPGLSTKATVVMLGVRLQR